jgi:hypothetical protein
MKEQLMSVSNSGQIHGQFVAGLSFGFIALATFLVYRTFLAHNSAAGESGYVIPALLCLSSVLSFLLAIALHRGKSINTLARFSPLVTLLVGYSAYLIAFNL